eukprot:GFYU01001077.1.p1 GENE.GFYU01001077.1~~GFYU01001077.1.p1  ORF type:complete len:360 (+),score=113.25 GFYU01001077.1:65-1081(+)
MPQLAFEGFKFIIMGNFKTSKYQIEAAIKRHNGVVQKGLSGATTHVVCGEKGTTEYGQTTGPGSKKYKEAKKKKKIIWFTEAEFYAAAGSDDVVARIAGKEQAEREKADADQAERDRLVAEYEALEGWPRFDKQMLWTLKTYGNIRGEGKTGNDYGVAMKGVGTLYRWYGEEHEHRCDLGGGEEDDGERNDLVPLVDLVTDVENKTEDELYEALKLTKENSEFGTADKLPPTNLVRFIQRHSKSYSFLNNNNFVSTAKATAKKHLRIKNAKAGDELFKLFDGNDWEFIKTDTRPERRPDRGDMECATPTFGVFFVHKTQPDVVVFVQSWSQGENLWTW